MQTNIQLDELTTSQVEKILTSGEKKYGALLPVGCTEQHGPDVPIGCDTLIAKGVSSHLAENLLENDEYGALVMPALAYAPTPESKSVCGSVSVSFDWMGRGIKEILTAACESPWDFFVIINGHAHNNGRIIEASMSGSAGEFGRKIPIVCINLYEYGFLGKEIGLNPGQHAGEFEMSLYQYYAKDYQLKDTLSDQEWLPPRPRPPKIFGLDILPRSNQGVISDKAPSSSRAIELSKKLGRLVDEKVLQVVASNLDIYFQEWNG